MSTPGFTPEIALQESGRRYQASASVWSATSLVQPALVNPFIASAYNASAAI
jgi:hypothetical protein